jgi:anti-sigma regulatory factor (Ser/Thr protein kinase)
VVKIFAPPLKTTITHIEPLATGDIWFSTLERGMGVYHPKMKNIIFYLYKKQAASDSSLRPIQNFYIKSSSEFFVAVKDSFPAIFNTSNGRYKFITDPLNGLHFTKTRNSTTDIKVDSSGNFYFIKGGMLYSANIAAFPEWLGETKSTQISTPLIYQITNLNKRLIAEYYTNSGRLKQLTLNHNQTSIIVYFTSNNFKADKRTEFAWKLEGSNINYWYELPGISNNNDSSHIAELANLNPGKYKFRVKMRIQGEPWDANEAELAITVLPPYWSTLWFWSLVIGGLALLGYLVVKIRVNTIKKSEKVKLNYEKHLIELEAKALRSQMNPHFVFNCLNSIKALMQDNDTEKGVNYLTTFSKLIRTLFNNADKKEITLYDEIETCKYYLQLEAMRFDTKFSYIINVSHEIDLKSIYIPALIIQLFIENAIWHGIIPKPGGGNVTLSVLQQTNAVEIIIEDDGIGREASAKSRTKADIGHQSKGVNLTQSRLELDNLLRQRFASIKTVDKFDNEGKATGTKVIVSLPLEE